MRIKLSLHHSLVALMLLPIFLFSGKSSQAFDVKAICEDVKDPAGCEKYFRDLVPGKNGNKNFEENQIIESLRSIGAPHQTQIDREYLNLHFSLMHSFWRNKFVNLPDASLHLDDGFLKGCGKLRISSYWNVYCPDYSEITLNAQTLVSLLPDKSNLNINYLNMIILAHEFGHHVNWYWEDLRKR